MTEASSSRGDQPRAAQSLAEVGEFGLIRMLVGDASQPDGAVLIGPGDDAGLLAAADGRFVASVDLLVEGRHFRRDWSEPYDIGRKAAAQAIIDVVAMGAVPTGLLIGLGAPAQLQVTWVRDTYRGLRDEAAEAAAQCSSGSVGSAGAAVAVPIAGGDTVCAPQVLLSVTVFGDLRGRAPVRRAGARPGDEVAVCGRLGWSAAGYAALSRGFRSPRVVVEAHRRPEPPYAEGPRAADAGATAMCDVSDGLLADLRHLAVAGGVRIDVDPDALEVAEPLRTVAAATGADPLRFVLAGGEDHALVATFRPGSAPAGWSVIGSVHPLPESGQPDVSVAGAPDEQQAGHDHFG